MTKRAKFCSFNYATTSYRHRRQPGPPLVSGGPNLSASRITVPAVLHCFTGASEALKACLDLGLYIGITGWICDERRGLHLRELIRDIPLERLMLETDAPFLLPRTMPAKPKNGRNEPAFLPYVLEAVARCLAKSPEEIAEVTTKTARGLFRITAA